MHDVAKLVEECLWVWEGRGVVSCLLCALLAVLLLAPGTAMADGLISLQQALLRHGFRIEVRQLPGRAYGRFIPTQKLLEISPVVHELGIAQQVLLHEAVHAA